jgi:hypothetical protein
MVGTCVMLFFWLLSTNCVSAWITWYSSTHRDFNTTPGTGDDNEISQQTDSTTSVPGRSVIQISSLTSPLTGVTVLQVTAYALVCLSADQRKILV